MSDLLGSERGIFCIFALVACTVLVALGSLTGDNWLDFTKYLVGVLVASKTVTRAVELHSTKKGKADEVGVPSAVVIDGGHQQ